MDTIEGEVRGPSGTRVVPAGVEWDAVRVPRHIGLSALQSMDDPDTSVIVDPAKRVLYFLVPVAAADAWKLPEARILGAGQYLVIPPLSWQTPPGPYWLSAPAWPPRLTRPEPLRAALQQAADGLRPSRSHSNHPAPQRTGRNPTMTPVSAEHRKPEISRTAQVQADAFDLDISVLESGDAASTLINLTDDGCKASCPESCATNVA